jgi:hypothetical protein
MRKWKNKKWKLIALALPVAGYLIAGFWSVGGGFFVFL